MPTEIDSVPGAEPLAIVGAGCRFPGDASTPEEFWALLAEGRDTITEGPPEAWRREALAHPEANPHGAYLTGIDGFDWRAFHTSPREARFMDPQQRLALEVAWEAFEHAGMPFESLSGRRAAVAVGIMWPDYAKLQAVDTSRLDGYTVTGSGFAYAANRISAFFDLVGPSFSLDVMCASGLAAVHLVCQSIWSGEAEMGLAAGVNLILSADTNVAMTKARILSPDGRCKTFDERANGFVRGEGAGAVVIKPAARAAEDGDRVLALIRGTAFNHSGRNEWIMAPSREAQARAIEDACRRAGITPADLDYVEMHGTGTEKGDPIEAAALGDTVGRDRSPDRPCRVGSVKTNIGHLDSAAGIAGLVKAALALRNGAIPPSLHFSKVNPSIDLDALRLEVQTELGDWPDTGGPRLAGVACTGLGAANAHVVLEGAPEPERVSDERPRPLLLPVSAESDAALGELLDDYAKALRDPSTPDLDDFVFTAGARRTHRAARAAAIGSSAEELAEGLEGAIAGVAKRGKRGKRGAGAGDPVLVFSGQNCSWAGMGRGLLGEPAFRETLDRCAAEVERRAGWSLLDAIEQEDPRIAADGPPSFVQPALCALQLSLTALWRAWGVEPAAVVGHSVGEIAAACAAGAFGLEDAMRIAVERGAVMDALHGRGRTAAVALAAEVVEERIAALGGAVWIAGVNAPAATVVAGEPEAVARLVEELRAERVQATLLGVQSAFHGGGHEELARDLEARLAEVTPVELAIPMVSTLTGEPLAGGEPGADYWAAQMLSPVRFRDAVSRLIEDGHTTFVEVAPHGVLRSAVAANLRDAGADGTVITSLRRDGGERADMLRGLARLYELGQAVDWRAVNGGPGRVVTLPRYRWQHQRLWLDPPSRAAAAGDGHPLLGRHLELGHAAGSHLWEGTLDTGRLAYLLEHRIDGVAVFPGSGYVELVVAAAEEACGWAACELQDLRFERALVLGDDPARIQTLLEPDGDGFRFSVHSEAAGSWTRHVTGVVTALDGAPEVSAPPSPPDAEELGADQCYAGFVRQGVDYGPAFRGIARAWTSDGGVLAELQAPPAVARELSAYRHHPALLDAWMHVVALAGGSGTGGFMPTAISRLRVHAPSQPNAWSAVSLRGRDAGAVTGDLTVTDDTGRTLVEGLGLRLRQLGSDGEAEPPRRYDVEWHEAREPAGSRSLPGSWLVLADSGGVGERAAEGLRERGATATIVRAGEAVPGEQGFDAVLHLWSLDAPAGLPRDAGTAERLTTTSLIELSKTLEDTPVWIVTRGAQAATGDDATAPLAAVAWGLGRTLAQENPALFGGLVDLDPAATDEGAAATLLSCLERDEREDQRALRGDRVLVPRLLETGPPPADDGLPELRSDAAYLVTGGLGGLGGATARRLAERGAGHLVLVGRTPRDELGPRLDTVRELETLGANVHVAVADVGEAGSLEAAVAALRADGLPPIRGAVHAAGIDRRDSLDEMTGEAARAVLGPKVDGTLALHHALEGEPLDFFVVFSSIAALLSSPRMGHYAAGNAFQGAFAAHRRALGLPAQALYWGIWGEVGMAVATDGGPLSLRGHRSLSTAQGVELLAAAMREPSRDLALFEMDWAEWRRFYPRSAAAPLLERIREAEAPPEPKAAPAPAAAPTARSLADRVVALVADVLKLPAVDPDESLSNLGFDSLMAAELRVRIQDEHGVRIPMLRILEAPSIGALAEAVVAASGGEPVSANGSEPQAVQPETSTPKPPVPQRAQADILDEFMIAVDDVAPATVHSEVRVEGRVDAGRLTAAIREAVEAHPIARARLAPARPLDRHYQWDLSQPLLSVPLEEVECEDDAALARARERLLSQAPSLETAGPFKVLLAHHPGGDAVILNIHHAAGDGVAGFRFMTSIVRAYAGEPDPPAAVDPVRARDVRNLVGTSARERRRRVRGAANLLMRVVRPPARMAAPAASDRPGYGFELFTLTPDQVEEVVDRGPRGATLNDVLLGGLAVAIRRWNERHGAPTGEVQLMMPVNVRPPAWSMDVLGNFAPWAAVRISPREQADLGSAAKAAVARTRRIRENGIAGLVVDMNVMMHAMPVTWARRVATKLPARIGVDTAMLSNIGHVDGIPARLGDAGRVTAIWGTPPGYPPMNATISVAIFASKLFIGFRYALAAFDSASARDFALNYRHTLLGRDGDPRRARAGDRARATLLEAPA